MKRHALATRRQLLFRAAAIPPTIAALLAACIPGNDADDGSRDDAPTASSTVPAATLTTEPPTPAPTAGEPKPTSTPAPAATARPTASPFPPDPARHFQITTWLPVIAMNPHVGWRWTSWMAGRLALEPLIEFNANLDPVLYLAAQWPTIDNGLLAPDGRWVTWKLRRDVRWHDGEPFDADDVITTWRFATNADGGPTTTRERFNSITDIERIDDHTVRLNFSRPNPQWADLFRGGDGVILPSHVFEPLIGKAANYQDPVNLVLPGTGPWKVTSFDHSSNRARYERFKDYWEPTSSIFDTIEFKFLSGDPFSNAVQVLKTGDADYAPGLEVPDPDSLSQLEAESSLGHLQTIPGLGVETLFLNFADPRAQPDERRSEPDTNHPMLSDLRVRQALSLVIPRDQIADLYGPYAEPFVHPLAAPEIYHGRGLPAEPDLARARALLDEAEIDGGTLLIQTNVNSVRQAVQEMLATAFEGLGFTVELNAVDSGVFFSSDPDHPDTHEHFYADMQLFTAAFGTSPYPLEWAERFRSDRIASAGNGWSEPNISRYANPEFDRLHDLAKVEMHPERQAELWRGMLNILTDDVVVIPLLRRNGLAAVSNRVAPAGFSPWTVAPSWNLQHWTLNE